MSDHRFEGQWSELRTMAPDARAPIILDLFRGTVAEFVAMALERAANTAPLAPPADPSGAWIRETLQDLGTEHRCAFLAELFTAVCREYAALVAELDGPPS